MIFIVFLLLLKVMVLFVFMCVRFSVVDDIGFGNVIKILLCFVWLWWCECE